MSARQCKATSKALPSVSPLVLSRRSQEIIAAKRPETAIQRFRCGGAQTQQAKAECRSSDGSDVLERAHYEDTVQGAYHEHIL